MANLEAISLIDIVTGRTKHAAIPILADDWGDEAYPEAWLS